MKFNVNNNVRIKLTDKGRCIHKIWHEELVKELPQLRHHVYVPPKEDADGWSTWQLHAVMHMFGPHMVNRFDPPFEITMEFIL